MDANAPETVRCPCGTGYAHRLPEPIVEPARDDYRKRRTTWKYRHEGCPVGGHISLEGGRVICRAGPLFHDGRSRHVTLNGGVGVAADGGFDPDEATDAERDFMDRIAEPRTGTGSEDS